MGNKMTSINIFILLISFSLISLIAGIYFLIKHRRSKQRSFLIIGLILIIPFIGSLVYVANVLFGSQPSPKVGGQCDYMIVQGKCGVTSISGDLVRFSFEPTGSLKWNKDVFLSEEQFTEDFINKSQKENAENLNMNCLQKDLTDEAEIKKCISEGSTYICEIDLITKGTCSPVIYRFFEKVD